MRNSIAAIIVLALMALPAVAWASPSMAGPTGLLFMPTADTLGMAEFNAGASAVWVDGGDDATLLYANIGIIPKLEIGFSREDVERSSAETILNAKFHFLGGLPGQIDISVGVMDITDQIDRSGYAVVSHELGGGIFEAKGRVSQPRIHGGIGTGRLDDLFGGISINVGETAVLLAEYDGDQVHAGVRWPILSTAEVTLALVNDLDDYAAGISVTSPW